MPKNKKPEGKKNEPKVEVKVEVESSKKGSNKKGKGPQGPRPKPKNVQQRYTLGKDKSRSVRIDGYDYLASVVIKSTDLMGATKLSLSLNPTAWTATRVQAESKLWQRYRPKSVVLEITSSASKMMGGQYGVAWTADYNDYIPEAGEAAMGRLLSYQPSKVRPLSSNLFMRIPVSMTQKWYYLKGSENSDTEYGKIFLFVASPLANVTNASSTSLIVRMRWSYEFSYPEMPPEVRPDAIAVYASAGRYFSDSSGDWKGGAYLTFKWHEGGDITAFPHAVAKNIYKISDPYKVQYYATNGTLQQSQYAVCPPEQTEENLPMLALVKDLDAAKAWMRDFGDSHLLPYYGAGPTVYPDNPAWFPQQAKVELEMTRHGTHVESIPPVNATFKTYDQSAERFSRNNKKLVDTLLNKSTNPLDPLQGKLYAALTLLSHLEYEQLPDPEQVIGNYLKTVGAFIPAVPPIPVRKESESSGSSFSLVEEEPQPGPSTGP